MLSSSPGAVGTAVPPPTLADVHFPRALAVAQRLLGCRHLAEDVLQEALLTLWRQTPPPVDTCGWLVHAVRNRARHLRRTLHRRRRHEACAAAACELPRDCDNPLHHAYAHELHERLDGAAHVLPDCQLELLRLRHQSGLDYAGLARHLGVPLGTVRSRLHRARAALLAALPADERGPAADAGLD